MKLMKVLFSALFLLFCVQPLSAQKDYTLEADGAFNNGSYFNSIELYKKAYSKVKKAEEKKRILFQIGLAYYNLQDNSQAENWLKKTVKAGFENPDAQLYLAHAMRRQGRFEDATAEYEKYLDKKPDSKEGKLGVEASKLAQEWMDNPTRYVVEAEPLLNSKQYDFAPSWADKKNEALVFTSTREGSIGDEMDNITGQSYSSIWYTELDKKGKWMIPTALGETINTQETNEGAAAMNERRNYIYFTRCQYKKNKIIGCDIYSARKMGRNWGDPELVDLGAADSVTVGHPFLAFKDEYLLFASDMPGGQGGKDIWIAKYDRREKTFGAPVNLGPKINTAGNEMFPYVSDKGDLYFASDEHPGMGGLDIFKATRVGKEIKWENVENMKYPINSPTNDFGIIFDGKKNRGFLTSDRDGGRGGDDIWSFRFPPLKFIIDGTVTDLETGEPIPGATVTLKGTDGSSVAIKTDELGNYEFDSKEESGDRYVVEETSYTMEVTAEQYLKGKGQETTVGVTQSTRFKHDFKLQPFSDVIEFPEVRYDLARWELQVNDSVNSKDSLDFLYQTLIDNPNIVIELKAHTDTRGSDAANQTLSQKRAESCVEYLISKGIASDRMVPKGYGEELPKITDEQIAALPTNEEREAAHQKNRRTEFGILRDDYVPKEEPATEESEEGEAPTEEPAE